MKKAFAKLIGWYMNVLVLFAPRTAGRMGFYLFCSPQGPPMKDHQRKFLETAEKSTFQFEGHAIQVYRWGNGPKKLLFLHGWQSHSFRWKNYIESFPQEEYTLYALDAPGHGLSGGKYLNLVVYTKVIEKFFTQYPSVHTIISHSLGSFAALYTIHRIPGLPVSQLIVTGTPGEAKEFVKYYQDVLGLSNTMIKAVRRSFQEEINHLPEYFSASKFAESVTLPGLIIHDVEDTETPHRHAIDIHRAWKESKLITTSGLGHNLRSATVVKNVFEFVTGGPSMHKQAASRAVAAES